ncbi:uridine kinase family protein [Niallia nealsonii]|uniref:uridine kinase family protein n=1 Tax=Niallia nealsonii TaxID=115979 RepID=UPI0012FECE4A|nr:AAA family ATPase [Niallia nealsonii]
MNISVEKLYKQFIKNKESNQTLLIGIDGCGGSGKSTLAESLKAIDQPNVAVIHMDDFYKTSKQRESVDKEIGGNWDCDRVKEQVLIPLSKNQNTRYQRYDWNTDQISEWHNVSARGVVIIEGCYSLIERFRTYYDFTIWMETPRDVRLSRGIERDGEEKRGLWEDLWMPAEELYIKAQKPMEHADFVIDGTGKKSDIKDLEINVLKSSAFLL